MSSSSEENKFTKPKKHSRLGRLTDVKKKLYAESHETGEDCKCIRFRFSRLYQKLAETRLFKTLTS